MATREPIYSALAQLVFSDPRVDAAQGGYFKTTGRFLYHHEQIPAGAGGCPAMFLVQHPGETHERAGKGIPPKRTLRCSFVMYFFSGDPTAALPATACNAGMDAIDDVINLPANPGNVQTLGGLVEHVYTEGAVGTFEGLLQEFSVVTVPITIVIP